MNKNSIVDGMSFYLPKNIIADGKAELIRNLPESVRACARDLQSNEGYRFYVVNQTRGFCNYTHKVITIPSWAVNKGVNYKTWYLAHEMAHAHAYKVDKKANHGPVFMKELIKICPENAIHHELGYKPRNAANVGITKRLCFEGL